MKCIEVRMILEAGEDDMPNIMRALDKRWRPKQLFFNKTNYYVR